MPHLERALDELGRGHRLAGSGQGRLDGCQASRETLGVIGSGGAGRAAPVVARRR
jgi:hypothetical protein